MSPSINPGRRVRFFLCSCPKYQVQNVRESLNIDQPGLLADGRLLLIDKQSFQYSPAIDIPKRFSARPLRMRHHTKHVPGLITNTRNIAKTSIRIARGAYNTLLVG